MTGTPNLDARKSDLDRTAALLHALKPRSPYSHGNSDLREAIRQAAVIHNLACHACNGTGQSVTDGEWGYCDECRDTGIGPQVRAWYPQAFEDGLP